MSPIQPELQLAQANSYTKKDLKSSGIGSLFEKQFLIMNELKTSSMVIFSLENSLQNSLRFFFIIIIYCESLPIYGNLKY